MYLHLKYCNLYGVPPRPIPTAVNPGSVFQAAPRPTSSQRRRGAWPYERFRPYRRPRQSRPSHRTLENFVKTKGIGWLYSHSPQSSQLTLDSKGITPNNLYPTRTHQAQTTLETATKKWKMNSVIHLLLGLSADKQTGSRPTFSRVMAVHIWCSAGKESCVQSYTKRASSSSGEKFSSFFIKLTQ